MPQLSNVSRNQFRLFYFIVCLYPFIAMYNFFYFMDEGFFNSENFASFINNTLFSSMWRFTFGAIIYISTWFSFFGLLLFKNWGRTCFTFCLIASLAMELLWWSHLSGLDLLIHWIPFFFKGLVCLLIYCTDLSLHFDNKTKPISSLIYLALLYGFLNFAILGLKIDDDLEPSAASLLAEANPNGPSNAYYYLLGMDAPPDKSPFDAGREIASYLSKAEQAYQVSKNPDDYSKVLKYLNIKIGYDHQPDCTKCVKLFTCSFRDDDCVQLLLSDQYDFPNNMGATQQLYLKRYQDFLNLNDYKTLHKYFTFSYDVPAKALTFGNRLVLLTALNMAKKVDANTAIDFLINDIKLLRKQLESADSNILKVLYIQYISNNIDVISYLMFNNQNRTDISFQALTPDEKNFRVALARELSMTLDAINQDVVSKQNFKWIYSVMYKENMMANLFHKRYLESLNLATGSPKQFADSVNILRSTSTKTKFSSVSISENMPTFNFHLKPNDYRNFLGVILTYDSYMSRAHELDYIANMFDMDVKIALFNQVMQQRKNATLDLHQIQNPYGDFGEAHYEGGKNRICLGGPFKDYRKTRCLWLGGAMMSN